MTLSTPPPYQQSTAVLLHIINPDIIPQTTSMHPPSPPKKKTPTPKMTWWTSTKRRAQTRPSWPLWTVEPLAAAAVKRVDNYLDDARRPIPSFVGGCHCWKSLLFDIVLRSLRRRGLFLSFCRWLLISVVLGVSFGRIRFMYVPSMPLLTQFGVLIGLGVGISAVVSVAERGDVRDVGA